MFWWKKNMQVIRGPQAKFPMDIIYFALCCGELTTCSLNWGTKEEFQMESLYSMPSLVHKEHAIPCMVPGQNSWRKLCLPCLLVMHKEHEALYGKQMLIPHESTVFCALLWWTKAMHSNVWPKPGIPDRVLSSMPSCSERRKCCSIWGLKSEFLMRAVSSELYCGAQRSCSTMLGKRLIS